MSEWKEYLIEELIQSMQLGTSEIGNENNFGVPLLKMGNLLIGGFNFEKLEKLKENDTKKLAPFILKKGDFLFNTRNTLELVGKSAVWNNQLAIATFNSNIMRIKFKEEVDDFYLGFYFSGESGWSEFKRVATGTTSVAAIYSRDLLKCKVLLPEYKSQLKIARILSTADAVIEKTQAAITKYKAIKQGMLHDLFTRGIDPATGKLRPTYEDAPVLYKESKLGWIPKEWSEGKFINFADERISHSFTGGPFGSDLQTKHYTSSGVRIIQLQNIGDGVFNNDYKIYTSDEKANQLINCNIYHGEIIISKMADPIARACIIPDTEKRYLMASDGIRLSIDKKKFNSRFVMETINHKRFRTIAELKATGSTRARIGLSELREIAVVYPGKKEQDAIGIKLDTIENKLQTEQIYLHKLQQIKAGLMADLLSGKKKVNVDEEPVN